MGVRVLYDPGLNLAALYCSVTEVAFGPLFNEEHGYDADERAEAFLRWLKQDARVLSDQELRLAYSEWRAQELEQWRKEEAEEEEAEEEEDNES